jgi:hypothetical protein
MFKAILFVFALGAGTASYSAEPVLDNERVTVWDATSSLAPAQHDFVAVSLSHRGTAIFGHRGEIAGKAGVRTVVIELKDHPLPAIANTAGYPLAFPRPNARKLLENRRAARQPLFTEMIAMRTQDYDCHFLRRTPSVGTHR